MDTPVAIIGWDIGKGSGPRAVELSEKDQYPNEVTLVRAHPDAVVGGPLTQVIDLDIWGLDPRLTLIVEFYHRLRFGGPTDGAYPMGGCSGSIRTFPIVRPQNPEDYVRALQEIPADDLFTSGGYVNDGCEISSGMQGIRFEVTAILSARTDHDIVASVQVKPNCSLGCVALAQKLINRLNIVIPEPIVFTP